MNVTHLDIITSIENASNTRNGSQSLIASIVILCSFSAIILMLLVLCAASYYIVSKRKKIEVDAASNIRESKQSNGSESPGAMMPAEQTLEVPKPRQSVHSLQYSNLPTLKSERRAKKTFSFVIIVSVIILLIVASLDGDQSKYHLFAYLLIVLLAIHLILLFSIVLSSDHLHMIVVKRKRLNDSQFLFVPYEYVEDKHRSIPRCRPSLLSEAAMPRGTSCY